MTPARHAEIRAYIQRLDLDQLPPWTVEQAIIRDLWEALPEARALAWDEGQASGWSRAMRYMTDEPNLPRATNPYRGGDR